MYAWLFACPCPIENLGTLKTYEFVDNDYTIQPWLKWPPLSRDERDELSRLSLGYHTEHEVSANRNGCNQPATVPAK